MLRMQNETYRVALLPLDIPLSVGKSKLLNLGKDHPNDRILRVK